MDKFHEPNLVAIALIQPRHRATFYNLQVKLHQLKSHLHQHKHKPLMDRLHIVEQKTYNKRFTKEDDKYTPGENYKEESCSGQHSMTEPSERISHHFLLPKAMKAHADLLESLSSLVSNATSSDLFGVFVWASDLF
jgi:hypothetical protein